MPLGGAQKRSSFDNPTLVEESRTRLEPERGREADESEHQPAAVRSAGRERGQLLNANLVDYRVPRAEDLPL